MSDRAISPRKALAAGLLGVVTLAGAGVAVFKPFGLAPATPAPVRLIELIGNTYPLDRTIDALASPDVGAPTLTRVRQGNKVKVVGIVEGDGWYQIELPNQQLAYVQVGAIPAAAGPAAPEPDARPARTAAPTETVTAAANAPAAISPAEPAITQPSPYAADASAPAAEPEGPPTVVVPPVVQFDSANDIASVSRPTSVYLKPSLLAPQAYSVEVGRQVYVIAESKDGNWAWVNTLDNAAAYIPMADLTR